MKQNTVERKLAIPQLAPCTQVSMSTQWSKRQYAIVAIAVFVSLAVGYLFGSHSKEQQNQLPTDTAPAWADVILPGDAVPMKKRIPVLGAGFEPSKFRDFGIKDGDSVISVSYPVEGKVLVTYVVVPRVQ